MRPMKTSSRPSQFGRHGILLGRQVVDHFDAGEAAANNSRASSTRDLSLGLDQNAFAVAIADRHANAGRADLDRVVADDLARLVHHLHFFRGVALVLGRADLRNQIEGDRRARTFRYLFLACRGGAGAVFQIALAANAAPLVA